MPRCKSLPTSGGASAHAHSRNLSPQLGGHFHLGLQRAGPTWLTVTCSQASLIFFWKSVVPSMCIVRVWNFCLVAGRGTFSLESPADRNLHIFCSVSRNPVNRAHFPDQLLCIQVQHELAPPTCSFVVLEIKPQASHSAKAPPATPQLPLTFSYTGCHSFSLLILQYQHLETIAVNWNF